MSSSSSSSAFESRSTLRDDAQSDVVVVAVDRDRLSRPGIPAASWSAVVRDDDDRGELLCADRIHPSTEEGTVATATMAIILIILFSLLVKLVFVFVLIVNAGFGEGRETGVLFLFVLFVNAGF